VRTAAQAQAAAAAGAVFISSTTVSAELIAATKQAGLYSLPGVSSTAEARSALACGADSVKFYPAASLGAAAAAELCTCTDASGSNSAVAAATAPPILAAGGLTPDMLSAFTAAGIAQLNTLTLFCTHVAHHAVLIQQLHSIKKHCYWTPLLTQDVTSCFGTNTLT
jgi:2-keto-3-deoxy-6-phosphogluconate aldolase